MVRVKSSTLMRRDRELRRRVRISGDHRSALAIERINGTDEFQGIVESVIIGDELRNSVNVDREIITTEVDSDDDEILLRKIKRKPLEEIVPTMTGYMESVAGTSKGGTRLLSNATCSETGGAGCSKGTDVRDNTSCSGRVSGFRRGMKRPATCSQAGEAGCFRNFDFRDSTSCPGKVCRLRRGPNREVKHVRDSEELLSTNVVENENVASDLDRGDDEIVLRKIRRTLLEEPARTVTDPTEPVAGSSGRGPQLLSDSVSFQTGEAGGSTNLDGRERTRSSTTRQANTFASVVSRGTQRTVRSVSTPQDTAGSETSFRSRWKVVTDKFTQKFVNNEFGLSCNVCDRLWFRRDLKRVTEPMALFLQSEFEDENTSEFDLCSNCYRQTKSNRISSMSRSNGYAYPPKPSHLPPLDPISERLISPRIPFMQIRRLRRVGCYGIVGQVINVPVDVDTMVRCLPRSLDDDYTFNVNLKKHIIHKSSYLSGCLKKSTVYAWLRFLVEQPLYKYYNIEIDWSIFNQSPEAVPEAEDAIQPLNIQTASNSDLIVVRQQTMMWNEQLVLDIAPGQNRIPESLIFDEYAEELSFPNIYFGVQRLFKSGVRATSYTKCTSEIRRTDRRGATPQHVLYMAMKIMRLRVRDGIQNMYRCIRATETLTRAMIEDRETVERLMDTNQIFLKTIPNSVQYWASRKKDLFAMLRQLGKPTAFLTVSANETQWPDLIRMLHCVSDEFKTFNSDELDHYQKAHLIAEDPVACCIYFHKLVHVMMSLLRSKNRLYPFGQYQVVDYFVRIEFQHRGSPHAHILLWLNNDPHEVVGEDMPLTVQLLTQLCSVDKNDLDDPQKIKNQTHNHTFTCTKRGEQHCRFNIPYWPMKSTRVLLPMSQQDNRRDAFKKKAEDARSLLRANEYVSIDEYLIAIECDEHRYLDIIRSSLKRPMIMFKRDMTQIYINTFNPWIASLLNSNMDLQFILDEYSCASYVVDYVNKSNRGISNLHRELTKIHEENPEFDLAQLMTKVSLKMLNSVEMSAQEAAWFLLRQPMCWSSRATVSIPTMWPNERYKARKLKRVMDDENLPADSTDIWTKSLIEKYEMRLDSLETVTLAQFAAKYNATKTSYATPNSDNDDVEVLQEERETYLRQRKLPKIIRYRNYDKTDVQNFKREMVTLYLPFRNEHTEIIDRNQFLQTYEDNEQQIMQNRKEFEFYLDIDQLIADIEAICASNEESLEVDDIIEAGIINETINDTPNDDDFDETTLRTQISAVRRRADVMQPEEYCALMRLTNAEQRELILEVISRIHRSDRSPIQIFLTGPAGCGKTFTLKILMETYNRFLEPRRNANNSYIATATTGKAAVALEGVTVHSAFSILIKKKIFPLPIDTLRTYRRELCEVKCVIIDEISMCSSLIFNTVNERLRAITGEKKYFGGLDLIACGDLKQLPPVCASPVYKVMDPTHGGALVWQSLDYYPLTQVVRQSDVRFSSILTKIGSGKRLSTEETAMIQSRFQTRQWCKDHVPNTVVRLFFNTVDVDRHNMSVIQVTETTHMSQALDVFTNQPSNQNMSSIPGIVGKMKLGKTGFLPYLITLQSGYPYMLTVNIDVRDGLVNGAIGVLKHVENYPTLQGNNRTRLWLKFENDYIGRSARLKYRSHVRSKSDILSEDWIPIEQRTANFTVKGTPIKCHRLQFSIVPACALTIHKSQGGTFDKIVYNYSKSHTQQLVYVALSRVTSLEGLFITNDKDDNNFYHSVGSTNSTTKEVQDEYQRLNNHPLQTLTQKIKDIFFTTVQSDINNSIVIVNINAQSLPAHTKDISTDKLLTQADVLVITETWMKNENPVSVDDFRLAHHTSCVNRSGGVAVYQRSDSNLVLNPTQGETTAPSNHIADLNVVQITAPENKIFILVTIYVHQHVLLNDLIQFLENVLIDYRYVDGLTIPNPYSTIPMVLLGDFNMSEPNLLKLSQYLQENFRLELKNDLEEKTTRGRTCLDLTFSRYMTVICMPYVSYFSYHFPVFNRITL